VNRARLNNYEDVDRFLCEQDLALRNIVRVSQSLSTLDFIKPNALKAQHQMYQETYDLECGDQYKVVKEVEENKLDIARHRLYDAYSNQNM
jgi:hypothetical protein